MMGAIDRFSHDALGLLWRIAAVALATAGIGFLLWKAIAGQDVEYDFRFLWAAGHVWAAGGNPYGPAFPLAARSLFPTGILAEHWFYPPHWWALCRLLAAFSQDMALLLWRIANIALIPLGAVLIGRASPDRPLPWWDVAGVAAYATWMQSTAQVVGMGQTSIIAYFGLCLLGFGVGRDNRPAVVVALVILLLKPQIGFIAAAAVLAMPARWRDVPLAFVVAGVLSLPVLWISGARETIIGFLHNLPLHGGMGVNQPINLTGFIHLIYRISGANLSGTIATLLGGLLAGILTLCARRWKPDEALLPVAIIIACASFIPPLHGYDLIELAPFAALLPLLNHGARLAGGAGLALAFRAANIEQFFAAHVAGFANPGGQLIWALAGLLALTAVVIQLFGRAPPTPAMAR